MAFNDAIRGTQAQPGAFSHILCGEEGIKDAGEVLLLNTLPRIRELQGDPFPVGRGGGGNGEGSIAMHRLCGIDNDVDQDLFQLTGISTNEG